MLSEVDYLLGYTKLILVLLYCDVHEDIRCVATVKLNPFMVTLLLLHCHCLLSLCLCLHQAAEKLLLQMSASRCHVHNPG